MSEPDKKYNVGQKTDGSWGCSCPRWIFSKEKPRPDCKHILRIKAVEPPDEQFTVIATKASRRKAMIATVPEPQLQVLPVFYKQTRRHIQLED